MAVVRADGAPPGAAVTAAAAAVAEEGETVVERDPVVTVSTSAETEAEGRVLLDWPQICSQVCGCAR